MPQDGVFSSIKQNLRETDGEVVSGHFDLGEPPNVHRYYCLIDPKTGRREPNGVLGEPAQRPDGMTRLNGHDVSMYTCARAEQKGYLVTQGYLLPDKIARALAPAAGAPLGATAAGEPATAATAAAASAAPQVPQAAVRTTAPITAASSPGHPVGAAAQPMAPPVPLPPQVSADKIDVAGVRLGMSPEEVRVALRTKKLRNNKEWTETLSYSENGAVRPIANGRFVNLIAAWTAPAETDLGFETEGEAFEVMFTPIPGAERVMAVIHTQGFAPADAVHETALDAGLLKKYGGYVTAAELPDVVTWRFQSDGSVQLGDACGRRGTFGGLGGLAITNTPRQNLALRRTPEELRAQIEGCGGAIVTADHYTTNGGALAADRLVTRFTVTAYSPALALDGAMAAERLIRAAGHASAAPAGKDAKAPDL